MNETKFRKISAQVMKQAAGSEMEILYLDREEGLARFAHNAVSQHIQSEDAELVIRIQKGGRQGRASCNQFDRATLERTVAMADRIASATPPDASALSFPAPKPSSAPRRRLKRSRPIGPGEKVDRLRAALEACRRKKTAAAGIFSSGRQSVGVANSQGLFAFEGYDSAAFGVTVLAEDSSGWAEVTRADSTEIHPEAVVKTALEKALASRRPKNLAPGPYDVILEPAAVAELLLFMAWEGFGALPYLEGRSFVSGKIGERVLSDRVTILDDAYHPLTLGLSFDYEGMPKQKATLIDRGTATGVVHDRKTARAAGTETTGHALPQPNTVGPMPLNLSLLPGDSSVDEMVAGTERGLLVTHFHYTNILDPLTLMITGMTRDGLFWVEKGKVRHPVKNLRFTESVVGAFNRVEALGREAVYAHAFWGGGIVAPAAKIRGFNFSSGTRF